MTRIYPSKIIAREISIGRDCLIGDGAFVALDKLVMEEGSQIAPHAILSGGGTVNLGRYSVVGFAAQLITGTDTPEGRYMCEAAPPEERSVVKGSITLGEGAYVGSGAIVCVSKRCPHIVLGSRSVIGAQSYIDRSISPETKVRPSQKLVYEPRGSGE